MWMTQRKKTISSFFFFYINEVLKYSQVNVQLVFEGNFAEMAGDGGQVDRCSLLQMHFLLVHILSIK